MKKNEKRKPYFVVFLVEGESDRNALEIPLSDLICEVNPDYEVRFLLQEKIVNDKGKENNESFFDDEENELLPGKEYKYGGDITSSEYVEPGNIENKITNRFIKPAIRKEGLYPKKIAKIIQIVDLDGAYISNENIVPYSSERREHEDYFYNDNDNVIETKDVDSVIKRNERKRKNIEYLLSLSENGIRIQSKTIPYEIYFFSSNLDHFINYDANLKENKKYLADAFLRRYGINRNQFCNYFLNDKNSIGFLGYKESWERIKIESNSIKRYTNIDFLIRRLLGEIKSSL